MKKLFETGLVFFFLSGFAQENLNQNVYFDFDSDQLKENQKNILCDFIQKLDTAQIQTVRVIGYCDDRGTVDYNITLSGRRVNTVQKHLISIGINPKKLITLEGKGRQLLVYKDSLQNIVKTRSTNRRVEVVVERIPQTMLFKGIPKLFTQFSFPHQKGDRIYLQNVKFSMGSSALDNKSKSFLDEIVLILNKNKNIEFEIQGHVCCTPKFYKEAIDKETREPKLSYNRARSVYLYFVDKNINPKRMTFKGCGNQFPIGKGAEHDRRVELVITKT